MRVLLAPTLSSDVPTVLVEAASLLDAAWSDAAPHDAVDLCPLSDGGPGFAELVAGHLPVARAGSAWVAPGVLAAGATVYVDAAVGLRSGQGTAGVGEQLLAALAVHPTRVVLGLPGPGHPPVVPDAGAGLLGVLGAAGLRGVAADALGAVTAADLAGLDGVLALLARVDLVGAHADDLPLLGLHGASAAAGRAEGDEAAPLGAHAAQQLERDVGHLAHLVWTASGAEPGVRSAESPAPVQHRQSLLAEAVGTESRSGAVDSAPPGANPRPTGRLRDVTGLPGAGAGGGLGWLVALAGGRLLPGAAVHADAVDLRSRVATADLVVVTVDHLDASTFHGSGAEQAAGAAAAVGVPCVVVAGTSMMSRRESSASGLSAVYVASEADARGGAVRPEELADVVRRVARSWSPARAARG